MTAAASGGGPAVEDDSATPWPPSFPHADIDRLVERLETGAGDTADAEELLLSITREAQRLRSAVVRLSAARLSSAEQEASTILVEARTSADDIRRRALRALDDRLDEADQIGRAMRRSFLVEHRLRGHVGLDPHGIAEDDACAWGAADDDLGRPT
jgi:hypothetical protein